jgi:hypothetical protein
LTFADGETFRFVSRAIAEAALSELLKIRKAKHPRPKFGKRSSENDSVIFTDRKFWNGRGRTLGARGVAQMRSRIPAARGVSAAV